MLPFSGELNEDETRFSSLPPGHNWGGGKRRRDFGSLSSYIDTLERVPSVHAAKKETVLLAHDQCVCACREKRVARYPKRTSYSLFFQHHRFFSSHKRVRSFRSLKGVIHQVWIIDRNRSRNKSPSSVWFRITFPQIYIPLFFFHYPVEGRGFVH